MPPIIAMPIWRWLIDQRFGVLNYLLFKIGVLPTRSFNWFRQPLTGWMVITAIVVWGALPFVVISLHAALVSVSSDHIEAARLDGAGAWAGVHGRHAAGDPPHPADHHHPVDHMGLPGVRPDLAAARHRRQQGLLLHDRNLVLRGILLRQDFGFGAAISVVSVLLLGGLSALAVRHALRSTSDEATR